MSLVATALPVCAAGRSEALYGPKEISVGLIVVNCLGAEQGLKEIDTAAITVRRRNKRHGRARMSDTDFGVGRQLILQACRDLKAPQTPR